jgi:hypothetical protein
VTTVVAGALGLYGRENAFLAKAFARNSLDEVINAPINYDILNIL